MKNKELIRLYREACLDNIDALAFLLCFLSYAHAVDDLVDEEFTPEKLMDTLAQGTHMYATPFFLANSARLTGILLTIGNTYSDAVSWEKSGEEWKRNVADVIRLCGNDMVIAVAQIVGGWRHGRNMSERIREFAWHCQHEPKE